MFSGSRKGVHWEQILLGILLGTNLFQGIKLWIYEMIVNVFFSLLKLSLVKKIQNSIHSFIHSFQSSDPLCFNALRYCAEAGGER